MLNPANARHRSRLPQAVEHSYKELRQYARRRDHTIRAYLGITRHCPEWDWTWGQSNWRESSYERALPKGNLMQTAALSMQIALAYGEPEYLVINREPEHAGTAFKLDPTLNRMSKLLDLGETSRQIAADSFFGYGIWKVGVGSLPLSARAATGKTVGSCVWRVNQNNYLYDITAPRRGECAYEGDIYTLPVEDAIQRWPNHADRLLRMTDTDQLQAQHVLARHNQMYSPEPMVMLYDMYFPSSQTVATFPLMTLASFGELADEPLGFIDYDGHWSGIYEVLTHLYTPDELIPMAQAESAKAIHFLFQDLMEATAHQARTAKVNPIYQEGNPRDMQNLWNAEDRTLVSVTNPAAFGVFEIPGPSQSQTQYMAAVMQLFKQMNQFVDEPHRAPTATQGTLERQTTNAIVAEARRKFHRSLQLVGYKLGHLIMNDPELRLPSSRPVRPGSRVMVDTTWLPAALDPRRATIDDFDISIEPFSTVHRSAEEKRDQILGLIERMVHVMQYRAMGAPINIERLLDIMARYSGTPELRELFEELKPEEMAQRAHSRQQASRPGSPMGHYVRENVSTKTDEGAFLQNLMEAGSEGGTVRVE